MVQTFNSIKDYQLLEKLSIHKISKRSFNSIKDYPKFGFSLVIEKYMSFNSIKDYLNVKTRFNDKGKALLSIPSRII